MDTTSSKHSCRFIPWISWVVYRPGNVSQADAASRLIFHFRGRSVFIVQRWEMSLSIYTYKRK